MKYEDNEEIVDILMRNIVAAGNGGILQDTEMSEREIIIVIQEFNLYNLKSSLCLTDCKCDNENNEIV